jgi:hypothetical protein
MGGGPDIAIVLHPSRDAGPVLDVIGGWMTAHGNRLLMRAADAERWNGDAVVVSDAELAERAGAVVALGGDGTMLVALGPAGCESGCCAVANVNRLMANRRAVRVNLIASGTFRRAE